MKWIKSHNRFINEAKIRDVIFKKQAAKLSSMWGERFLDYYEVTPTENIKQGKWKLSEEDKISALGYFFDADMGLVFKSFENLPDKFAEILSKSIDFNLFNGTNKEKYERIFNTLNIKTPSIDQIVYIYENVFRKLSVGETTSTEMVSKGEDGRPIMGEDGKIVKIQKLDGDPIFSKNLVNINSFIQDFNRCYPDHKVGEEFTGNREIINVRNMSLEDCDSNFAVDFEIFGRDLYLSISHNPKDILNMSISKFYSSCQHLYDGGYNEKLLGNVFDPNSIPAFLLFDTPIYWGDDKVSDVLPLSRMIIRNIEGFDNTKEPILFFDRAYPDRMKDFFNEIVEKYSDNHNSKENIQTYTFAPDVDPDDFRNMREPYMDKLSVNKNRTIGVNTKKLYLNRMSEWSSFSISKNANIKELIVETTDLPENFFDLKFTLEWIKFKFINILDISKFSNVKSDSIAFDKCKLTNDTLIKLKDILPDIKKLQIVSCDIDKLDLSVFNNLDELNIIYTTDDKLQNIIGDLTPKKLVVSGDMVSSKEDKEYIKYLRNKGIKVEIVGLVL